MHFLPIPIAHFYSFKTTLKGFFKSFLQQKAGRTEQNHLQITVTSGILIPFLLHLLTPTFDFLDFINDKNMFLLRMNIHPHARLLPFVRNPRSVKAIDIIRSEKIKRNRSPFRKLSNQCGFTNLTWPHYYLHPTPWLSHSGFKNIQMSPLVHSDFINCVLQIYKIYFTKSQVLR